MTLSNIVRLLASEQIESHTPAARKFWSICLLIACDTDSVSLDLIAALVERGADVNIKDEVRATAIFINGYISNRSLSLMAIFHTERIPSIIPNL